VSAIGQQRNFTGAQKAAVLLLALGEQLGPKLLQSFEAAELKKIIEGTTALGGIEKNDLEFLVNEFAERFARTTGLVSDPAKVRTLLEAAFPGGQLDTLLEGPRPAKREPIWASFKTGGESMLAEQLLDEHPQTVAYIISKLERGLSASVLILLPRELRVTVTGRLLKMGEVKERPAEIVEDCLREELLATKDPGQEREARARVAALMNELNKPDAEAILEGLSVALPDDAKAIKSMLFSFEDISKLDQKSRVALFDKVQTEQVIPALRGTSAEFKELVLSALGQRARRMAEAELSQGATEVGPDGLKARRAIVQMALSLAASGDFALPSDEAPPQPDTPA
jgi:flagellar motor switch protein FliG